ncbi:MAG: glycine oxidase ThiO [Blastocatellia bacterium]|nr:MAG: glycine oxidase ThiO [Blastocatellia bacterium]
MSHTTDIAIIGGGVIGLSIARSLALRGAGDITLIERGPLGAESSSAAAGMLAPQAEADSSDEFFQLLCHSRDLYSTFAAALLSETGTDIELDTTGTLYLAFTEHDEDEIGQRYEWQTQAGLSVEQLTSADARLLEPSINADVRAALRFPLDIQVENRRLVSALADAVNDLGVKLLTETEVHSVTVDRGRVTGLQTSRGSMSCERVVLAAGCWTGKLTIETLKTIDVEPVRGQMICFATKPQLFRHVIYSPRGYLVPRRDGRLLAGSTSESAGYAKHVTAGGVSKILENAHEISPSMAGLPFIDSWAGLRPRAADGLPVMGACDEIEGLFYATGHYRNGILLTPITGELMADVIVNRVTSPLLRSFSPNRFNLVTS